MKIDKDIRKKQGVYAVWVGDYVYVGSGYLGDRISGNLSKLKRNVHANEKLQQAYNKVGEAKIEVIGVVKTQEEARMLENIYIEHYKRIDNVIICNKYKAITNKEYKRKLTENDVRDIRELIKEGKTNKEIANIYNVNSSLVSRIKTKKRWGDVV